MEHARSENGRTGRTLAIVGGGALLLWWLLRGGGGGIGSGSGSGLAAGAAVPARVNGRVDAGGISVDGQPMDVAGAAAAVAKRGQANVIITGAARVGTVDDLLTALRATGAQLYVQSPGGGHA
jgi:hypothetical protein